MFKLMRRAWRDVTAALTGKFNEAADPKIQLEQAIIDAQDQHRRLVEQAANVIAKQLHYQSTQAADQAKGAVTQNSSMLQRKLAERQKLLGQLDQAKMQEQMNKAMASLSETVGEDVPTFDEVRQKIEARYAKARGMSELTEESVESRMLEVEQAAMNTEAQARLAEIKAQLGIASA